MPDLDYPHRPLTGEGRNNGGEIMMLCHEREIVVYSRSLCDQSTGLCVLAGQVRADSAEIQQQSMAARARRAGQRLGRQPVGGARRETVPAG